MRSGARERSTVNVSQPYRASEDRDANIRVIAAAAVRKGGKVLMLREEDEPYRGSWVLPQGYPRPGETLEHAAAREAGEELGLDVEVDGLLGVYDDFSAGPTGAKVHWVIVCFLSHPVSPTGPRPSREAIDFAWVEPSTISPSSPEVVRRILSDLARTRDGLLER
jgi:8-oxo-dGTP diphosphatase